MKSTCLIEGQTTARRSVSKHVPIIHDDTRLLASAKRLIKCASFRVVALCQHPNAFAPTLGGIHSQTLDQPPPHTLTTILLMHRDLVDEELRRLVRPHLNGSVGETDDRATIQRHDKIIHPCGQKRPQPRGIDGIIKNTVSHTVQHIGILWTQSANGDWVSRHVEAPSWRGLVPMKLADLDVIVTAPPAPGWGGRYWILVKLTTDTGITGWGECYASSVGPEAMTAVIRDVFARHMEGENPENIELMFRRAYSSGFTQRPDLTVMGAFSGLEIACWDILGKDRDRPVWALLGGKMNDRVRAYTYLYPLPHQPLPAFWGDADMAAEAARDLLDRGYTAVKFDPAGPYTMRGGHQPSQYDVDASAQFCATLRKAVGCRADLLFGTHGQFTPSGAIRLSRALEPHDPLWFEEPVPPDDMEGLAQVTRATSVPVATGERLTTMSEFAAALRAGAAILQPALGRAGGIWEGRKIAILAQSHGAQMAPHLYAGPVEWAANIQLSVAIPNLLIAETIETPFHADLIRNSIRVEDGHIPAPTAPGLGIEVDEALARAHPYTGDGLHLQMQEDPPRYDGPHLFEGGAPVKDS